MLKSNKKIALTLFIFLVISCLTILRENFFLEINAVLKGEENNQAYFYYLHDYLIENIQHLIKLKWILTLIFSGLIALLTVYAVHKWFNQKEVTKTVILFYAVGFALLFFVCLGVYLVDYFDACYFVLRKILGFVQSPLPLFLFFVAFYNRGELK